METIWENLKFFFQLYFRPARAFGNVMDNGSWLFGAIAVLVVSLVFQWSINSRLNDAYGVPRFDFAAYQQPNVTQTLPNAERMDGEELYQAEMQAAYENYGRALRERRQLPLVGDAGLWFFNFNSGNFLSLLLALAVFYVPATILLLTLFEPIGSFGLILRRDYGTFSTCVFLAWAAAHLPFAIVGLILKNQAIDPNVLFGLWLASGLFFAVLMIFALRTVFGASYKSAIAAVSLSWLSISAGSRVFAYVSPYLLSPFLLFYAFLYLRGEASTLGNAFRQRQNFRRFLQNATVNPRDADAHVQLGILYKQRRQLDEAVRHFERAIEIEPQEIEANHELGKIARERGELEKALQHFSIVVEQNEKHALNEIWREIGATYADAKAHGEAREFLEKFVERRPFDPEGLFRLGQTLKALNLNEEAREMFRRCVEAVQTSPDYRRGQQRKWSKLAEKQMAA
jgi:tetratricopeptide (TPR) repeat protein